MRAAGGVSGTGRATGTTRRDAPRGRPGFSLEGAATPERAGVAVVAPPRAPESLLAVQVLAGSAPSGAAAAVEHVNVMMGALSALQRALLSGDARATEVALRDLALRRDAFGSAVMEPELAEILDAVQLRVEIEIVRRGWLTGGHARVEADR